MHDKAKEDPTFHQRLLDYITHVVAECMPEEPPLNEDADDACLFQDYTHPDDPNFNCVMRRNLSIIVRYRQMQWFGVAEVAVFLVILAVGYIWAYKKGALEWV